MFLLWNDAISYTNFIEEKDVEFATNQKVEVSWCIDSYFLLDTRINENM